MSDRPSKRQKRKDEGDDGDSSSSGSEAEEAPGTNTRRALTLAWLDPAKEADFDGRLVVANDESDDEGATGETPLPPGVETASRPLFTHQQFDDERVEGYEGLRMTLAVSRRSFLTYAAAGWTSKEPGSKDVLSALESATAAGTCTVARPSTSSSEVDASALASFREKLSSEPGDLPWSEIRAAEEAAARALGGAGAAEQGREGDAATAVAPPTSPPSSAPFATHEGGGRSFSVHLVKLSAAGPRLRAIHERMSSLFALLIDAASPIDPTEDGWDALLAVDDSTKSVAGIATLFSLYGFPDRTRLRVCQVCVLPPCQGCGLGKRLVEASYEVADRRGCLDVTFEDPTDEMQGMRERVEAKRALSLPWLCRLADAAAEAARKGGGAGGKENGVDGKGKGKARATGTGAATAQPSSSLLSADDAARARLELRISRQQVPLAFEALLALRLGVRSPELRECVRARLAASVAAAMNDAASKRVFDAPRPAGGGQQNPLAAAMAAAASASRGPGASNEGFGDAGGSGGVSGFVMCKVTPAEAAAAAAAGIAAPAVAEEEGAAEKNAAAIEQATKDRIDLLEPVVAGLSEG